MVCMKLETVTDSSHNENGTVRLYLGYYLSEVFLYSNMLLLKNSSCGIFNSKCALSVLCHLSPSFSFLLKA